MSAPHKKPRKKPSPPAKIVGGLGFLGGRLVYWMPVMLAFAFFAHTAFKALRPALTEQRRLEVKAAEMELREAEQAETLEALKVELEALDDPIYQERVRRAGLGIDTAPELFDGQIPYLTEELKD